MLVYIQNSLMQELFVNLLDLYNEVLTEPLKVKDGHCTPPEGPGWGTDIKEDVLEKYPSIEYTPIDSEPYTPF